MKSFTNFLDHWQTLFGSITGPFLAVVVTVWIADLKERKEFLRKIEISITRSLLDIYTVREQLVWFSGRIDSLVNEINNDSTNNFFLVRLNFPSMREIYRNTETLEYKIKSYYLHNKLLWVDVAIKDINSVVSHFKDDFEELTRQNEQLVMLLRMNPSPNPTIQKNTYVNNLINFRDEMIKRYADKPISQCIQFMTQIKVYNNHLRSKAGAWFHWKHEGVNFRPFLSRDKHKAFANNLKSLDRIDKEIKFEVEKSIAETKKRSDELAKEQ